MNLNHVTIIGRVTQDPEARTTTNGANVTSFSVATNLFWNNQQGERQEQTEFHNVVAWRKLGEIAGKYLVKGQEVYIAGRLQTRSWEGQDGVKRYRTEIVADKIEFGAKPGGYSAGPAQNAPATPTSAPAQAQSGSPSPDKPTPPTSQSQPAKSQSGAPAEEEINIEDIPF